MNQKSRRGSTPVSTVLRNSVKCLIITIFLIQNTILVEIWPIISWLNDSETQERGAALGS